MANLFVTWGGGGYESTFATWGFCWNTCEPLPADAVVADISEPKSGAVPSEALPSALGLGRQLLNDGGEEKVVPPPGRSDGSEKLRKSGDATAEGILLALVSSKPGDGQGLFSFVNQFFQTKLNQRGWRPSIRG